MEIFGAYLFWLAGYFFTEELVKDGSWFFFTWPIKLARYIKDKERGR